MRTLLRLAGETLVTLGLVAVLFTAYELWGTGDYTRHAQRALTTHLDRQWRTPTEQVALFPGRPFAVIRIPRLGRGYRFAIVEGVSAADLRMGPGHYPGTALPGRIGNFVVSGHRTTYLAPFNRIDELARGDEILIDTRSREYVYRVTRKLVVPPTDLAVVAPVPLHPHRRPHKAMITLTTCHPKYSAAHRLIVVGELAAQRPRPSSPDGGT